MLNTFILGTNALGPGISSSSGVNKKMPSLRRGVSQGASVRTGSHGKKYRKS